MIAARKPSATSPKLSMSEIVAGQGDKRESSRTSSGERRPLLLRNSSPGASIPSSVMVDPFVRSERLLEQAPKLAALSLRERFEACVLGLAQLVEERGLLLV